MCAAVLLMAVLIWSHAGEARADAGLVDQAAAQIMGDVVWGMSPVEVVEVLKERLRASYGPQMDEARGALERDAVHERARADLKRIKDSYMAFDGRVTGWDISQVGPEFRHGSSEAMLYMDTEQYRDYFFFIGGRLWKCYRAFSSGAFAGQRFDAVSAAFERRLGEGEGTTGLREPGGEPARFVRFEGSVSRFDLVDGGTHMIMVASAKNTLTSLAALRRNALPRGRKKTHTVVDAILMSDEQQEALRNGESVETAMAQH